MKILILGKNGIKRKNWGHQLFLDSFKKQHEVLFFGEGHPNFNPNLSITEFIEKNGKPDLILTYMVKRCYHYKGLEDLKDIRKAHIEIDFFPKKGRYSGQTDKVYMDFFKRNNFDVMFATTSLVKNYMSRVFRRDVHLLPFSVNTDVYKNLNLNRNIDVMAVFSTPSYVYPDRLRIHRNLSAMGKSVSIFKRKVKHYEYVKKLNHSKISITSNNIYKSLSMRYTESLACGCLLLADKPEDMDLLGFKNNVHFVLYDNIQDLKEKIYQYLREDKRRKKISNQGMDFVIKNHSCDVRIQQFTKIIQEKLFTK